MTSDPEAQRRYQAHHAVAAQIEANAAIGLDRLTGDELKSARHLLHKLNRESKAEYDAAIAAYGTGFRARWAQANLRDRASQYGFSREYDFYRLASMVLHGSVGEQRERYLPPTLRQFIAQDPLSSYVLPHTSKALATSVPLSNMLAR